MDIHKFKVFASVFRHKNFSKASKELNLTQPTISSHIKILEEEFDLKLFERMGRTVIPTKQAEVLYEHVMEIIKSADILKKAVKAVSKDTRGRLVIGASTIPGVYLIPGIMSKLKEEYPSISFQVLISDSREIIESIAGHDLLLGIVGAKFDNDQIKYLPFVEDELIAVASPSLIKNNHMTLKDLVKLPMVLREEGSGTRRETEKLLESKGISLKDISITGIFGSTDAVKQAVKAGLGASILSKFSVADELKYKILEEIKLTDTKMKRRFYFVTHKKRTLPRLYDAFLERLLISSGLV